MAWEVGSPAPAKGTPDRDTYNTWRWGVSSRNGGAKPAPKALSRDWEEYNEHLAKISAAKRKQKSADQYAATKRIKGNIEKAKSARAQKDVEAQRKAYAFTAFAQLNPTVHPNAVTHDDTHAAILHDVADKLDAHELAHPNDSAADLMYAGREALTKHQIANQLGYAKLAGVYARNAAAHFSKAHAVLQADAVLKGHDGVPEETRPTGETYTLAQKAEGAARHFSETYPESAPGVKEPNAVRVPALSNFMPKPEKPSRVPWQQRPGAQFKILRDRQAAAAEKYGWDPEKIQQSASGIGISLEDLPKEERRAYRKSAPLRATAEDASDSSKEIAAKIAQTTANDSGRATDRTRGAMGMSKEEFAYHRKTMILALARGEKIPKDTYSALGKYRRAGIQKEYDSYVASKAAEAADETAAASRNAEFHNARNQ